MILVNSFDPLNKVLILLFCSSIDCELDSKELVDSSITAVICSIEAAWDSSLSDVSDAKLVNLEIDCSKLIAAFLII